MTHLGALGQAKPAEEVEEVTFDYFGETIHANPDLSELDYIDFMHIAGGLNIDDPVTFGAIKDFAGVCIVEADFPRFWKLAKKNRQNMEDLFSTCTAIVEAVTDRPTGRLSDSADGPTTTGTTSGDADYSRAMEILDGRPDLQLAVVQRRQHLAAVG